MSFSDVGRGGNSRRSGGHMTSNASISPASDSMYTQVSDSILQYQKHVGILKSLSTESSTSETQIKAQVDVISKLGQKIESLLREKETMIQRMARSDAAKVRATHIKLSKDFRRVESSFKQLAMELKRRKDIHNMAAREARVQGSGSTTSNYEQMSILTQQEENINEQLMREREAEIREINKNMHTVNEIYKDLALIVDSQQDSIDKIEKMTEQASVNAKTGLAHVEKANNNSNSCVIS